MAAAQTWAHARSGTSDPTTGVKLDAEDIADFAALGVEVPLDDAEPEDDHFGVWDVNWRSFVAFLKCETQWRAVAGFGFLVWLGLDYAGVRPVIEHPSGAIDQALFADLRVMERAALEVMNAPKADA